MDSVLNESSADHSSKQSLNRTNKVWSKIDDTTNKIEELFQEFVDDPSCLISVVGSFENKKINLNNLISFCDLSDKFRKSKFKRTNFNRLMGKYKLSLLNSMIK